MRKDRSSLGVMGCGAEGDDEVIIILWPRQYRHRAADASPSISGRTRGGPLARQVPQGILRRETVSGAEAMAARKKSAGKKASARKGTARKASRSRKSGGARKKSTTRRSSHPEPIVTNSITAALARRRHRLLSS